MNLAQEIAPNLPGIEQLRMLMATGNRPPIAETLDFDLIELGDGVAVFSGTPGPKPYNPIGSVHGGYAATLLDSACGCAAHTKLAAGQAYTTLELKVSYHKALTAQTGLIRAEGRVITFGRRAAFTEARIVDGNGRLYASATSTLLIITP